MCMNVYVNNNREAMILRDSKVSGTWDGLVRRKERREFM